MIRTGPGADPYRLYIAKLVGGKGLLVPGCLPVSVSGAVNRRDADHDVDLRQRQGGRLRAGRRVQDAGRNPAEGDEVGDPLLGVAPIGLHQPPVMGQVAEPALQRQLLQPQRDHRLRQGPDRVPGSGGLLCVADDLGRAGHLGDVPLGGGDRPLARLADHRSQRPDRDGSPAIG